MIRATQYQDLANGIIEQAAKDYVEALQLDDERTIRECERFFMSTWFEVLTEMDGEVIMEKLQKIAGRRGILYDPKARYGNP